MKKLLLLLISLFICIPAYAVDFCTRYSTGTALACYTPTNPPPGSGNLGIGTTGRIPVYIGTTTIGSPYNNVMDSNGNIGIGTTTPAGSLDVETGNNIFFNANYSPGNVSIGTNIAPYTLTVGGYTNNRNGGLNYNSSTNSNELFLSNGPYGSGTAFNITRYNTIHSGDMIVSTSGNLVLNPGSTYNTDFLNGNVGIGTTSPTQALQVNGAINIQGTNPLYFANDVNASISPSASTNADIQILTNTSSDSSTGGVLTIVGGNHIRTFNSSGTFTPGFTGNVIYFFCGGGGSGGSDNGGGGGGGKCKTGTLAVTNGTPITITVGLGGAGVADGNHGNTGSDSSIGALTAKGGGYGGQVGVGGTGGNGGGGGYTPASSLGGATNDGGFAGGTGGTTGSANPTGGGAGDGGAGGNATSNITPGNGGPGTSSSISGSSVCYGGGGAGVGNAVTGTATCGGGASGAGGTANTGGGGGGYGSGTSASGGSGVVIVSYVPTSSKETARFTTGGNVGIGTVNPGQMLDVAGTVRALYFSGNGNALFPSASTGQMYYASSANTPGATSSIIINGNNVGIGSATPGQVLDVNGTMRVFGNVGIGTVNPAYPFQTATVFNQNSLVYNTLDISGGVYSHNGTHGFTTQTGGGLGWDSSYSYIYGNGVNTGTPNFLSFGTNTTERARFDYQGNLGIGTVNPNATLDVEGTIGRATFFAGVNQGSYNLGIGSFNPGQRLDVQGTVRALTAGTCSYLYKCVGGVDAGVIQTSACNLCPAGSCTQMNGCF